MKSLLALALGAVTASAVSAQTVVQTSGQRPVPTTAPNSGQVDHHIASCLILGNLGEIELAEFAEENLDDGDVKKFATMLIEDHRKLNSELGRFAPQAAAMKLSASDHSASGNHQQRLHQQQAVQQKGTNITPGFDEPSPSQQTVALNPTGQKLLRVQQEAVQNCVAMTKEELQEHSGKHMEQAFLGCQIGSHIQMLAHLKAAENAVSGELKQVIAKAKEKVESHLDQAKKLMKEEAKS